MSAEAAELPPKTSPRHVIAAFAVAVSGVLPMFLTGALAVQISNDLDVGEARLGVIVGVYFLAAGLSSVAVGTVVQRYGVRAGVRLSGASSFAALLIIATVVGHWTHLLAALALGGVSNAIAQPTANMALATGTRVERQGLLFGIRQSAVPAAGLIAGGAVPTVGLTLGWRWAFGLATLPSLLAILVASILPPRPARPRGAVARSRRGRWAGSGERRRLRRIAVGGGLGAVVGNSAAAFLVPSAVVSGISEAQAGAVLALAGFAGVLSRVGVGWLVDKGMALRLTTTAAMLAVGSLGCWLLAFDGSSMYVVGAILIYAFGWGWPGLVNWEVSASNLGNVARATGTLQTGVFLGASSGPVLFGVLAAWSFSYAWAVCGVAAVVSAVLIWMSRPARMNGSRL